MPHQPKKRFGQHFLNDSSVIHRMIECIRPLMNDHFIEIGPGLGALTFPLLRSLPHLTAIEIDRDILNHLQQRPEINQLTLIEADALTINYSALGDKLRLVGNLPYNISTPLLFHLFSHQHHIEDMHFMLQKEVVDRLAASPGSKTYGRLSVMAQYYCTVEPLFTIGPDAFAPPPKVDSAIVRLTPHRALNTTLSPKALSITVAHAFHMRRKTILNNLKQLISAEELRALAIEPSTRPEQLSIQNYIQLSSFLIQMKRISIS